MFGSFSKLTDPETKIQKQPSIGVPWKRCSENMQQIYKENTHGEVRLQSNFIEITLRHGCSSANLLHIFRTTFLKNISGWLLLKISRTEKAELDIISECHLYLKRKQISFLYARKGKRWENRRRNRKECRK